MRKITDYEQYKNILPYSSEMFGVYQPLIGWKSKRVLKRIEHGIRKNQADLITQLAGYLQSDTNIKEVNFKSCELGELEFQQADYIRGKLLPQNSLLLQEIKVLLAQQPVQSPEEWQNFFAQYDVNKLLESLVFPALKSQFINQCTITSALEPRHGENEKALTRRMKHSKEEQYQQLIQKLRYESVVAKVLQELNDNKAINVLNKIFYIDLDFDSKSIFWQLVNQYTDNYEDPYLTFDPKKDVDNVSLSPLGIVHLYRQYFFEFDTFLGTPTGHVWMAPGSTVELIEVSTRRTLVEKTYETSYESITKNERSNTTQDELSSAVKEDNKSDLKLGFTTTVNQSWPTGSASATGSLNMDRTQQLARETTHKQMREQTQKLSTEIRENFKSTFKTITEETDVSSKRYVLSNPTEELINYELRRKMRQVGVQVQDIGSYLCWETFVDEPGDLLGLANLVHIAKPADLIPKPIITETIPPADSELNFTSPAVWNFGENRKHNEQFPDLGFVPLTTYQVPPAPDGMQLAQANYPNRYINIKYMSHTGKDAENQIYAFNGRFTADWSQIELGVITKPYINDDNQGGIEWDERIDFVVGGTLHYTVSAAKLAEIAESNQKKKDAATDIDTANALLTQKAFTDAAKERIELASKIVKRKYEDLREEERIIVYRCLIKSLMTDTHYKITTDPKVLHVLSELINSIFDINKMLYFVAPEWWKPRKKYSQYLGVGDFQSLNSNTVNWSDNVAREDNYYITDKSEPAVMGSSLGWLLQLDGDDLRNAFLNAPWVKAVIPVRPGKEKAAINWLQNVAVEGSDGLEDAYSAPQAELGEIRAKLLQADPNDAVKDHPQVTIGDAIRFLCTQVSYKNEQSTKRDVYPKGAEISDVNKVSATPVDKVYEYGFYPLQGGFRYDPNDPDPANPDKNFQVFDQWVEILPTDQVVPVEVSYDPLSGRLIPPESGWL